MAAGLLAGGVVRTVLSPHTPGEFFSVELRMADGSPEESTVEAVTHIIESLDRVDQKYRLENNTDQGLIAYVSAFGFDRINGRIDVELSKQDTRTMSNEDVLHHWREEVGRIHGADVLGFKSADGPNFGPNVAFDLKHSNFDTLRKAAEELEEKLRQIKKLEAETATKVESMGAYSIHKPSKKLARGELRSQLYGDLHPLGQKKAILVCEILGSPVGIKGPAGWKANV